MSFFVILSERGQFSEEEFNGKPTHYSGCSITIPSPPFTTSQPPDWYDNEHIAKVKHLPGFSTIQRYTQRDSRQPSYLTLSKHAFEDGQRAFNTPEFIEYSLNLSDREKHIISNLPIVNRRSYKPIFQQPPNITTPAAKYIFMVEADLKEPSDELDGEFNEWYNNVHIPDVMKTKGWVSSRRFQLQESEDFGTNAPLPEHAPTKYLAIHEFDNSEYMQDEAMIASISREETQKMAGKVKFDLRHFVLHKDFS
ncbi:hypothetical protein CVT24_007145 [Panaeolus cyanescens]|uniref:EthD domain-containing protein n=1 Tax=Panaeolus cyanescens TaxID=181874 RepID=A0A409YPF4_9AGAR|nr:hypothetical protein CVT24_007145 [Panaeolus cyanescens]